MRYQRALMVLLWVSVGAVALYLLLLGATRTIGMLSLPYQAEYGEGPVLDWARQITNGVLPYKSINTPPYNFSVYTPLYLVVSGVFVALFPANPYLGGRLISLLSAIGLAVLLWMVDWRGVWVQGTCAKRRTPQTSPDDDDLGSAGTNYSPIGATAGGSTPSILEPLPRLTRPYQFLFPLVAVILWLVSPYVFRWATFYRPDMLALFWSALGMVVVSRFAEREMGSEKWETGRLVAAAFCFVLAFFTKQSFFAAPVAALVYLVATKQYRSAVGLGVAGAVMGGVVGLGLYAVTGWALVENLIAANANPFSWEAVGRFWGSFITIAPILIILGVLALRHRENGLWGVYLGIAVIVSLSIGKAGAWENYFLEPLWILCLLATSPPQPPSPSGRGEGDVGSATRVSVETTGGGYEDVPPKVPPVGIVWVARREAQMRCTHATLQSVGMAVLVLVQLLLYTRGYERLGFQEEWAWLEGVRAEGAALQAAVNAIPTDVPIYSEQMGVLAELGRPVPLHSFVYTQLARQGLWDETELTTRLATGDGVVIQRFDAVNDPLERGRWSRAMLDAIEKGYGFGEQVGEWVIRPSTAEHHFHHPDFPMALNNGVTLLNWEAESCSALGECQTGERGVTLFPNGSLKVFTLWQSAREIDTPLSISVKLFDPTGQFVAQKDGAFRQGWMGKGWVAEATLRDGGQMVELPATLQSGVYTVEVTLYESESGTPLARTQLLYFKVPPEAALVGSFSGETIWFSNRLVLQGYSRIPDPIRAGLPLVVEMTYQRWGWYRTRYTTFMQLLDDKGTLVAQTDFEPAYPPSVWSEAEQITIAYILNLSPDLAPGRYRLIAGWYRSDTLERLSVEEGRDFVDIGDVLIVE